MIHQRVSIYLNQPENDSEHYEHQRRKLDLGARGDLVARVTSTRFGLYLTNLSKASQIITKYPLKVMMLS